jgi:hypothetical protein
VVACVHHDALGAHARAGHPSRRYPCPYVPIEAPGPTSGEERTRRWGHILALRQVDGLRPSRRGRKDLSPLAGSRGARPPPALRAPDGLGSYLIRAYPASLAVRIPPFPLPPTTTPLTGGPGPTDHRG